MFFRRRRAERRDRDERIETMQRLLEQFERLRVRVVDVEAELRAHEGVEAALRQQLHRAQAELAAARERVAALHELVGRLSAEAASERERRRAAEARTSLHDELAPLWAHLSGQRELLAGLAARLEHAVRPRPLRQLAPPAAPPAPTAHLLFLATADGYELLERDGRAPEPGTGLRLDDGRRAEVVKIGPAPLPGDGRRCAYAQLLPGLEPPANLVALARG